MIDHFLEQIKNIINSLDSIRYGLSYDTTYWEGDNGHVKHVINDIRHSDLSDDSLKYIRDRLVSLDVDVTKEPTFKTTKIHDALPTGRLYWLMAELRLKIEFQLGINIY